MSSTILRDSRTASVNFQLNSPNWVGVPKPNFLYFIRFVKSNAGGTVSNADWTKSLGILAKSIERPSVDFEVETVNQYNKKRVIQKKQTFQPISFTFHDTVDQKAAHLFEDYYRFYYGDPRNSSFNSWSWDIMSNNFNQGQGGWGFIPPAGVADYSYYFSHIELYYLYGGKYTRYDIINPKMQSFKTSSMAYSEGSGQAELTMSFQYEGLIYQGNDFNISGDNGLLEEMGLSRSGFYEPRSSSGFAEIGNSLQYNSQGAVPDYNSVLLSGINNVSTTTGSTSNTSFATLTDSNFKQNSIFNGTMFNQAASGLTSPTRDPTIEDNIAKRLVNGMK